MSRARLQLPLRSLLADPPPEDAGAMLAGIAARRRRKRRRVRAARLGLGAATALGIALALGVPPWPMFSRDPETLQLAQSAALPTRIQPEGGYRALQLTDGSWITVAAGARVDVLESSGRVFRVALRHGRARFDVRPNGPRRWYVECGAITVEVVGTSFTIERSAHRFRVTVMHGAVLVRGEGVPDHVQRVGAGRSLAITLAPAPNPMEAGAQPPPSTQSTAPAEALATVPLDAKEAPAASARSAGWRAAAKRGHWPAAWQALHTEGIEQAARNARDVDELLLLADVARLSGHARAATLPLQRIVQRHANDPNASLAAFTLATLRLDTLNEPARAAGDVQRALALGLPRALHQDAHARLVEAYARTGQREQARAATAEYRARFPQGARRQEVERWSAAP